jgi:3-deoxy-manno-octulosonate cytidylyltransferase (CMP-KDO synthetase)
MKSRTPFQVIIPARYASTRLPGKALLDIAGKPMLQHVYERALKSGAENVVIATDHPDIQKAAEQFGAHVCMTASHHVSGSSRLAEASMILNYAQNDIVVNVQCDEPLIDPEVITQLASDLEAHPEPNITATLYEYIQTKEEFLDPAVVKVVLDQEGYALYFSRAPIPWFPPQPDAFPKNKCLRHVGMYAYRVAFLQKYVNGPHTFLEASESLEQLRILAQGGKIHLTLSKKAVPPGVNTLEDLERTRGLFEKSI